MGRPYRFVASLVGLSAIFFSGSGAGAFKTLSEGAANLSWGWVAVPLAYVDQWVVEHLTDAGFILLVLAAVSAGFAYTETSILAKSRASATV